MTEFKIVLADPNSGNSYKIELKNEMANKLIGYKIGNIVDGSIIGIDSDYEIEITGGTDKSGFAMRKDLIGPNKRKILSVKGLGFNPKLRGQRKRKFIRGNEISQDITQINAKIIKYGKNNIQSEIKTNE